MDVQNEGQYKGRKFFERLNIENENQKTVDIAFQTLGEICRAVGLANIDDSEKLHGKRLVATMKVSPAKPYTKTDPDTGETKQYDGTPQNRVSKYAPVGGASTKAADAPAKEEKKAAEKPKGKTPPWKK